MENAVVYGWGMVGKATAHALGIKNFISRREASLSFKEAGEMRYHFICLPTLVDEMGRYKLEDIKTLIKQLQENAVGQHVYIIRSTVSPGTLRALQEHFGISCFVHVPEFLTEKTWKEDAEHPDIVVVGADQQNYRDDVVGIFRSRYKGVDIIETDSVTAELIKCARNAFYSTKVVFGNEIYDFAKTIGANYDVVREALYKSKWIGKNHLDVHHGGYRGLGGKCLPKDLQALAEISNSKLLKTVEILDKTYHGRE